MRVIQAIVVRNLLNFTRDRARLISSLLMPAFFLFVFSFVTKSTLTGFDRPLNYLIAGVIIMAVFQSALFNTTNTIDDIASGFMKEIIVAPIARWQIAIGQIISATVIAVLQGLLVIIFGLFVGLSLDVLQFLKMCGTMTIVGLTFSSIGLYLATLARNSATFQALIMLLLMPLTFLSGAYIPTTVMPKVLLPVVYVNPLTYTTSIFRYITLKMERFSPSELVSSGVAFNIDGVTIGPYLGLLIVVAMGITFFTLSVKQFARADFSEVKVFDHHNH